MCLSIIENAWKKLLEPLRMENRFITHCCFWMFVVWLSIQTCDVISCNFLLYWVKPTETKPNVAKFLLRFGHKHVLFLIITDTSLSYQKSSLLSNKNNPIKIILRISSHLLSTPFYQFIGFFLIPESTNPNAVSCIKIPLNFTGCRAGELRNYYFRGEGCGTKAEHLRQN